MGRPATGRNPRMNITLNQEVFDTVKRVAEFLGIPPTTFAGQLISDMHPYLKEMEKGLAQFKKGKDQTKTLLSMQMKALQLSADATLDWINETEKK